uniref:Uncharacterized protein n=1 Tax=Aegilops tauschii TaxID=37682 RepID=R7WGH8_AEGTA
MASFSPLCALVMLLAAVGSVSLASASVADAGSLSLNSSLLASAAPPPSAVLPRKVLRPAAVGADVPHRVSLGCAGADDIAIEQGPGATLPRGIPSYTVDIINRCSGAGRAARGHSCIRLHLLREHSRGAERPPNRPQVSDQREKGNLGNF